MTAMRNKTFFKLILNRGFAFAVIVHIRADQLLPQLWVEQFDTLPSHTSTKTGYRLELLDLGSRRIALSMKR